MVSRNRPDVSTRQVDNSKQRHQAESVGGRAAPIKIGPPDSDWQIEEDSLTLFLKQLRLQFVLNHVDINIGSFRGQFPQQSSRFFMLLPRLRTVLS
jgi:hypothetical protein